MTPQFQSMQTIPRARPNGALHLWLAALLCAATAGAHASDASCISAGRLNAEGRWAPQFPAVRLLDEAGRALATRTKADLSQVRAVEITAPALLSACEGGRALTRGDDAAGAKAPVPAVQPGRLTVETVGFPKLQTGGEMVELKVQVPPDRRVMITR